MAMSESDLASVRADLAAHRVFVSGEALTSVKLQRDVLPSLKRQTAALDARLARAHTELQHSVQKELDAVQRVLADTSGASDTLPARLRAAEHDLKSLSPLLHPGGDVHALQSQLDALEDLYAARGYYRLLAGADDLAEKALRADKESTPDQDHKEVSLRALLDLASLVQQVVDDWSSSPSADGGREPKIIGYLRAQLVKTYDALRQTRTKDLADALKGEGWPVSTVNEENLTGRKHDPEAVRAQELSILHTPPVRDTFFDLCSLQRVGDGSIWTNPEVHLTLTPEASFAASIIPAGSEEFTPLFPSAVLLQPTLQRFAYHFDTDHPSNRLDKPEWWMRHLMDVLAHQWMLWRPQAAVGELYCISGYSGDTRLELLHGILTIARNKLESSTGLLLPHPHLLAHTLFAAIEFDDEVTELASDERIRPTVKLSAAMLENDDWSRTWLAGEKDHALVTLKGLLGAPNAWTIALADGTDDDGGASDALAGTVLTPSGAKAPLSRTTVSSRELVELLEHVTGLYRPLPSDGRATLHHRHAFFTQIQRPLVTTYTAALQSTLEAFEASASVFARHMPGAMLGGEPKEEGAASRGQAGTARLASILVSAHYIRSMLVRWAGEGFFVELSHDIRAAGLEAPADDDPNSSVWTPFIDHLTALEERAAQALRRLVVGEVAGAAAEYSKRPWVESSDELNPQEPDLESVPTPSLLPALSTLSSHLTQLVQSLCAPEILLPLYRTLARGVCDVLIEKAVLTGGTRRFDYTGARRFYLDLHDGWFVVVKDVALRAAEAGHPHALGRRPEAAFRTLDHAATLLALPADPDGVSIVARPRVLPEARAWTIADAIYAAFDMDEEGMQVLTARVGELPPRLARDVLRRRIECWR